MKVIAVVKYLFLLIGLAMLVGAFFAYQNTQSFVAEAIKADGVVVDMVSSRSSDSITYRPVIEFKTKEGDLVEFTSSTGSNPPSYSRGETVDVLYQESMPGNAKINSFFSLWGLAVIVGGMGAVFFLIGFLIILFGSLKNRKRKYLLERGMPVKAMFQSVEVNRSVSVNGRHPYQIYAQWKNTVTNELHLFKSENIWFNPSDHISQEEITVFIEKDNPKKYYVDISFLPKLAN
ncbi:DUF3592 domain-containing protein [Zooshikella ganghwensis]|uniref:DUF3592 domain-containing protein n=1 Tax=Zooshikella ganghwensis TaxID=202772 RepID=UPI00197E82C6|nr:DUF3592 domain-containing protein [Zooshikella ganghwensis]